MDQITNVIDEKKYNLIAPTLKLNPIKKSEEIYKLIQLVVYKLLIKRIKEEEFVEIVVSLSEGDLLFTEIKKFEQFLSIVKHANYQRGYFILLLFFKKKDVMQKYFNISIYSKRQKDR